MSLQIAVFIIGTVIVVFGAYYVTYFIGVKASGKSRSRIKNRNINMLDRFAISKDKSFCIIEIAGKIYVVGITNQSMTLLDTIDAEKYAESVSDRADAAAPGIKSGGGFAGRFLFYMTENIRKPRGKGDGGNRYKGSGAFSDSMRSARDRSISGHEQDNKHE